MPKCWNSGTTEKEMKSLLLGNAFSDAIKPIREEGFNYLQFKGFRISVNLSSNMISDTDLTRSRFATMTSAYLCSRFLTIGDDTGMQISPFLIKVVFDDENVLTDYKYLLGRISIS